MIILNQTIVISGFLSTFKVNGTMFPLLFAINKMYSFILYNIPVNRNSTLKSRRFLEFSSWDKKIKTVKVV